MRPPVSGGNGSWSARRTSGGQGTLLGGRVPKSPARSVTFRTVERPLLVLGSTQPADHVDQAACAARGVEVVRRHSGGGAVLLEPGRVLWVDVVVPSGDPLWEDDVGRSFLWLGRVWAAALGKVGFAGAEVHRDRLVTTRWSRQVCFAGVGPGEITLAGRKVVGMAQRRNRDGALFHCAALLAWAPASVLDLLVLSPSDRTRAGVELADLAAGLGGQTIGTDLEAAFLAHLPADPSPT